MVCYFPHLSHFFAFFLERIDIFHTFADRRQPQDKRIFAEIVSTQKCLLFRSHFFIIRQNFLTILPQYHTFPRFFCENKWIYFVLPSIFRNFAPKKRNALQRFRLMDTAAVSRLPRAENFRRCGIHLSQPRRKDFHRRMLVLRQPHIQPLLLQPRKVDSGAVASGKRLLQQKI